MVRNDMEVQALSKLLGHEQLSTTMQYVDLLEADTAREYHAAMELVHFHRKRAQPPPGALKKLSPTASSDPLPPGTSVQPQPTTQQPAS